MAVLLVGTDFSTRSDRAWCRAIILARQARCGLVITHVAQGVPDGAEAAEAERLLRRIALHTEEAENIRCNMELRFGSVAEQLAAAATEAGADLVIIGPHRRSVIRDKFSKVTASPIAQMVAVPLLAANAIPVGGYRRALVPTDFGEASAHAVKVTRSLSFLRDAEPILLHVFDAEAREMLGRALVKGTEREEYLVDSAERARVGLSDFARDVGLKDARLVVRVDSGSIPAEVNQAADEEDADLILLSRSNKGMIAGAVLGSVTEGVLRDSKHDILIVP